MSTDDEVRDYDDYPQRRRKPPSAVPFVLLLSLAAIAGFAILGVGAFLFVGWGGARPPVPVAAGPNAPVAGPGVGGMGGPGGPMVVAPEGPQWVTVESDEFAFRAGFPHGEPQSFNPFVDFGEPEDQAAKFLKQNARGKYLQTSAGGRRYALVATPLELAGLPPRQYLRANAGNLNLVYKGWASEPGPEGESTGHAYQEFTLRKEKRVKLLRMVIVPGFTYMLTVDQVGDVTLADAMAKKFFEGFASTAPAKGK